MTTIKDLEKTQQHLVDITSRAKKVYMDLSTAVPMTAPASELALQWLDRIGNLVALDAEICKIRLIAEEKSKPQPTQRVIPAGRPFGG